MRNESGEIMRGLDRGEAYVVTRASVPVGELTPARRRAFDLLVAATALGSGLALSTRNADDFAGLDGVLDVRAV